MRSTSLCRAAMSAKAAPVLSLQTACAAVSPLANAPTSPCEDSGSNAIAASPQAIQRSAHTACRKEVPAGDTFGGVQPPGWSAHRVKCCVDRNPAGNPPISRRASRARTAATALMRRCAEAPTYHQPSRCASRNIRAGAVACPSTVRACTATSRGPYRRTAPICLATAAARPVESITHDAVTLRPRPRSATHRRPSRLSARTGSRRTVTPAPALRRRSTESNRARSIHHPAPSGDANVSEATRFSAPHAESVPPQRPSARSSTAPSPAARSRRPADPGNTSLDRWFRCRRCTSTTCAPSRARRVAAAHPAGPAPTTSASTVTGVELGRYETPRGAHR